MTLPLRDARITGEDVGYARAHATSTPHGDACGSDAIAQAIGAHSVVTATRSVTGHMSGRPGPWVRPWRSPRFSTASCPRPATCGRWMRASTWVW
ncbi:MULTISPECIES: hypothetical protein [unclassified Streptomyces]|uniref:hypothetical protein n=1 Tax=unclassified Streptomyces TaxID=2593676 RepID=UPI001F22822D|nr:MULTISPECIES: hypothetical protein [unclassified Streptomyces]